MRKIKVLLVCRSFDKNSGQGIYKMAGYLYENLRRFGRVNVEKIESKKGNYYYFDLIDCPMQLLLNNRFDVYHFLMPENCVPVLLFKKVRNNSIVTIHDAIVYKIKERRWLSEKYIKMMYKIAKKAQVVIVPSNQTKEDLIKLVKVPSNKIFILPWGVDLQRFRPKKRKNVRKEKLVIGYVGGLGRRKNIEWLIYLAKSFKNEIIVKIAGRGPQLQSLLELKQRFKLTNVEFLGFIDEEELPHFYNSIDIFVYPSLYEGFGIPLLEAMAAEVPYIIGTNAGIGELLPILKISNPEELVLVINDIRCKKINPLKNQREWIVKNGLTWVSHTSRLIDIYNKVWRKI